MTSLGTEYRAAEIGNRRMQREILPLLSVQHPSPRQWNPLRPDTIGDGYTLVLMPNDKLAIEILKSDEIMDQVEQIVEDSMAQAILDSPEAFVTTLLKALLLKSE